MKFNKFLMAGVAAGVIGTSANIALSTPINQPQTTAAYTQSSQDEAVNVVENVDSAINAAAETLPNISKAVFIEHAQNMKNDFETRGSNDPVANSIDEIYAPYVNQVYGENAYSYLLKKANLSSDTVPSEAFKNSEFVANVTHLKDVHASIAEMTDEISPNQDNHQDILNSVSSITNSDLSIKDAFNALKQSHFQAVVVGEWKNNSLYTGVREHIAKEGMSESEINVLEDYMISKEPTISRNTVAFHNATGNTFQDSQIGYFAGQEDIIHGVQAYGEYSNAVKANGQTPLSPKDFFENPQFKHYETNLHQTENYLALQGVPQGELRQKSIAMIHAEAANFIQAKDLGEIDSSIYKKQVEKYTQNFAASGLQYSPEVYANYKVLHPELNDGQVVEKADNSFNKLNELSKFEQIKFVFSNTLKFIASEPMLTASTIGGILTNNNNGEFNYKYAKFFSEKIDGLNSSSPKPEVTVAFMEDKVKDFSSAISLNFEGLMNKAQSFFEDKSVQSAELENKGTKNKM